MRTGLYHKVCLVALTMVVAAATTAFAAEEPDREKKAERARAERPADRMFALEIETGIGYDSNVYKAPDGFYVDFFPAVPIPITPVRHTGYFVPIDFVARFTPQFGPSARFLVSYRFEDDIYLKSENNNANKYNHKIIAGPEFILGSKGKKENTISVLPFAVKHKETYYDRDSGLDKTTAAGEDIEERYTYDSFGVEGGLDIRTTPVQFGLQLKWEDRDYENPMFVSQYDYTYYLVGGKVEIPVVRPTELHLSYDYYVKDYEFRHSRDLDGGLFASRPLLKYVYHEAGISLRNKLTRNLAVYLDYTRTDRDDANYVGYYDYTEDEYAVRAILRMGTFKLRAKYSWWNRDYPRAYAYENPLQSRMDYDGIKASVKGEAGMGRNVGLWAEYKYKNTATPDVRYNYSKYQVVAGVKWEI